ncbi:unnamed protein product [Tenebrio molitor]|jgi:hypothetical protein|nr:unnamed protein product [Tenebrio molitor]
MEKWRIKMRGQLGAIKMRRQRKANKLEPDAIYFCVRVN